MDTIVDITVGCVPDPKQDSVEIDTIKKVEVGLLSDELSQKVASILTARKIAQHPVKGTIKKIQCNSDDEALKKTTQPRSVFWSMLVNLVPFFGWIRLINLGTLRADIIAGATVGIMVIPQGMSYAKLAGLDYRYGMYSACVPVFVYSFFGTSRQLAVGPVALLSLLVSSGLDGLLTEDECPKWYKSNKLKAQSSVCPDEYAAMAFLVAITVGALQIIASIFRLGFLVSFLGHPVSSGFVSASAIIIGLSQVKYFLGFDIPKSELIYVTVGGIIDGLPKTLYMPLILGLIWLAALYAVRKLSPKYKYVRMFAPLAPLLSCIFGIGLVAGVGALRTKYGVAYIGRIPPGIFPSSASLIRLNQLGRVMPTALSCLIIGYMESVSIGKNLAARNGYSVDGNQELLALGLANVIGGLLSCYPTTGSFSRSAVSNNVGAKTQLAGLVTSLVMLAVMLFLTDVFYFLPQFVLAAIVLNSVGGLLAWSELRHLWHVKKQDFFLWIVAFLGTLFVGVLIGISIAVGLSLVLIIYESARPQITILWRIPGSTIYRNLKQESSGAFIPNVFIARIGSSMYFANANYIKDMLLAYVTDLEEVNKIEYIVLEMTPVISIDSTAAHVIHDIVHDFRSRGIQVAFAMVGNRVEKTLRAAKMMDFLDEHWILPTVHDAVTFCLRHQTARKYKTSQRVSRVKDDDSGSTTASADVAADSIPDLTMVIGNEVGFSNDVHASCTTVYVSIATDIPMILCDITDVFKRNNIHVISAHIEASHEAKCPQGIKHCYVVQSNATHAKLSEGELQSVREGIESFLPLTVPVGPQRFAAASFVGSTGNTEPRESSGAVTAVLDPASSRGCEPSEPNAGCGAVDANEEPFSPTSV